MTELTRIKDSSLFASHDIVNVLVFVFLLGLPYFSADLLVESYMTGKIIHLLGLMWFYGGLIFSSFCLSRFVWTQPSLDHDMLAYGYRIILVLEFWCIPSIALMAYGGMAMVQQLGGMEAQRWAYQGYMFLLVTPPILMLIPRFYHKRLIKNGLLDVGRERRKALWQDWLFIALMTAVIGVMSASMVWKTVVFQ
jgi:hypothetical protein